MNVKFEGVFVRWLLLFIPLRQLWAELILICSALFVPFYLLESYIAPGSLAADIVKTVSGLGGVGIFFLLVCGWQYLFKGKEIEICRHEFGMASSMVVSTFLPLMLGKIAIWYLIFGQSYLA